MGTEAVKKNIEQCDVGTVFLICRGEQRHFGIVTHSDGGDRGPGRTDYRLETGEESNRHHGNPIIIEIGWVADIGKNPLRTLLNYIVRLEN